MKPVHTHDCSACTFLGCYNGHDLYHCSQALPTVIARHGSGGGDYVSGAAIAAATTFTGEAGTFVGSRALRVAWLIARDIGLPLE